jgi:hypothetical protein
MKQQANDFTIPFAHVTESDKRKRPTKEQRRAYDERYDAKRGKRSSRGDDNRKVRNALARAGWTRHEPIVVRALRCPGTVIIPVRVSALIVPGAVSGRVWVYRDPARCAAP